MSACGDSNGSPDPQDTGDEVDADTSPDAVTDADEDTEEDTETDTPPDVPTDEDADVGGEVGIDPDAEPFGPDDCDPLVALECALPWPSSFYLEEDPDRNTGYTLEFGEETFPANFLGVRIRPDDYRRMDGFAISTPILAHFPNIDTSDLPDEYDLERSMDDDAPIVLFQVNDDGMTRVPYWVDLDAWENDVEKKIIWVRPAVILEHDARYIVAMRDLRDTSGALLARSDAFEALISGEGARHPQLHTRQDRFEEIFGMLSDAGVARDSLQLAWDFHTASSEAVHGPMLHMRREGFAYTGPQGPEITFTQVDHNATTDDHPHWAYVIQGYITVPDFMRPDVVVTDGFETTGYRFNNGEDGLPEVYGERQAPFYLGIPHSAMDGTPHGLVQYGHGFFGTARGAVGSWTHNGQLANEHNVIFFGGFWTGMAEFDFGTTQFLVFDLNHFAWLSDRTHQGVLEFLLLARSMRERLGDMEEITDMGVVVDPTRLYYLGISQGGIYGATYMALTQDITYGHLGVPGMNYGLLEHRSTNFNQFFDALQGSYPGRARQAILVSLVQILWDQIDPVTYMTRITQNPFEDDEPRYVLAAPSKGDLQVATVSMEIAARSNTGFALMENYDEERTVPLVDETPYPHQGSAIVLYNFGHAWPPGGVNLPPPAPTDDAPDAHNAPRRNVAHNAQMFHFFETGEVIDTCGGGCWFNQ